uniref:Uncharacterized protein n=1 Tax=Anguilla anguilla TaxID=7936 RepID=A0A0E9UG45_ANGAN
MYSPHSSRCSSFCF